MMSGKNTKKKVAVVGSGVAGLSAAYLMHRNGKDVTLYESAPRCGGHALTVDSTAGPVDLGFQVFNLTTYPHLVGLFNELGIESEKSDMSFALSTDDVEWGSLGLGGIFAQKSNMVSPSFLNMIREVIKFGKKAPEVLEPRNVEKYRGVTLGEYLRKEGYSTFFADNYVIPMCAAIWSCSNKDTMAFPIVTLIRFWVNHHLLNIIERPLWRVVKGRSKAYVDAIVAALPDVRVSTHVFSVKRVPDGVFVTTKNGTVKEKYDDVIFACHSDQVLRLLGSDASAVEREALGAIKYQPNEVFLHSDKNLMPRTRAAWASWNCLKGSRGTDGDDKSVCVSYWVNLLQNLPRGTPDLFVTLNPPSPPAADTIQHHITLAHPLFNQAAIEAQKSIRDTQGAGGVWFCGAWCGYGFHEDGIKSAVTVADLMLGRSSVPWDPRPCDPHLNLTTQVALPLFARVGGSWVPPGRSFKMILPNGGELVMRGKTSSLPLGDGVDGKPLKEEIAVQVFDQRMFMQTVLRADIGFGESYMNGHFDCDLYPLLDMLCAGHPANTGASTGADNGVPSLGNDLVGAMGNVLHWLGAKMEFAAHAALSNTKEGSKKNIEYHYDAGNAFYKLFLDDTMLYSSGIHQPLENGPCTVASALGDVPEDDFAAREKHLEQAQYAKIDAMIARMDVQPGDHVLEIGCGWGTCAIRIATKVPGARVTGLTLSNEQCAEARARVKAAGLEDRIEIVIRDYRDVVDVYDKVISIEMLEAVGHEHLPTFFSTVSRALKPGGKAAIQVITMPDERYESYCKSESDFIRAYIFPGGHLPSVGAMISAANPAGLRLAGYDDIGDHYAVTLRLWRERMMSRAETVLGLGYSRKFLRMFEFYFAYCEAGFAHRLIYDLQMTWVKEEGENYVAAGGGGVFTNANTAAAAAGGTTDKKKKLEEPVDVTWAMAGATLCFWVAATLLTCRSKPVMLAVPVVVVATLALRYFATVAIAAVFAVFAFENKSSSKLISGGQDGNGNGRKSQQSSLSLFHNASCLASLAVSGVASLIVGLLSVAYVVTEAAAADVFNGPDGSFTCAAMSRLKDALLAVNNNVNTASASSPVMKKSKSSSFSNETAMIVVAITAALAFRRLLSAFTASASGPVPGVTTSSHQDVRVKRDIAVASLCFAAMYTDTYIRAMAAASVAHIHAATANFRAFTGVAVGFPHADSALHRASYPAELIAFFVTRFAPHAIAMTWTLPRATTAACTAAPAVTSALLSGCEMIGAAAGSAGSAALGNAASVGAVVAAIGTAVGESAASVASAASPAAPAVFACVVAAAANVSNLAALAQMIQERRAESAVRSRIIKLATSAEV